MRVLAIAILALTAAALCGGHALAQATITEPPPARDVSDGGGDAFAEALDTLASSSGETTAPPPRPPAGASISFTATEEMRAALGEAIYKDYQASLEHNRQVFEWQLRSSRITFWIVVGLVFVGVIFAVIQFAKSMRAPPATEPVPAPNTEFELTAKGLKVSSPVLGVIILVISLGFFYLFLVHVYPIEHVRDGGPPGAEDPTTTQEF